MKKLARLHAIVSGDVQGVGFRIFVLRRSQTRALTGWVRNCDDGSVEVLAEGERSQLLGLLEDLKIGPSASDVEKVDYKFEEPKNDLRIFTVM